MADNTLTAQLRTETGSRPAGRLRRQGLVPATVYGLDADPLSVAVEARELQHLLSGEAGANTLITLQLDGSQQLTLARQIQRHPVRGDLVHVDFVRIRTDVAVSAEVPVHLVGDAVGVTDQGGLLEQLVFSVTVEAKPMDIPNSFEVDVSGLSIGDQLLAASLPVPSEVELVTDAGELVAQVVAPQAEVEEEVAEAELAEGEVAEGAEGEGAEAGEGGEPAGE